MFEAFRERDYRRFWATQFLSNVGSWMQTVAQGWLVYRLTNSAFLLGMVAFAGTAPAILLMLPGGVLADQWNRRRVVIVSQWAQALAAVFIAVSIFRGEITIARIMFSAAVAATAMSFSTPAWQAMLVDLLDDRSRLPNAVAMNSLQFNVARAIGPVVAGFALSAWGAAWCFLVNALSFLPLIFVLESFRHRKQHGASGDGSMVARLLEGFRWVLKDRPVLLLLTIAVVASFFGYPAITLMPVIAGGFFKNNAEGLGLLMSAVGAGALCGALLLSIRMPRRPVATIALVLTAFTIALSGVALTRYASVAAACLFVTGGSMVICMALCNTAIQARVPDAMRGRVLAMYAYTFFAFVPFSNLIAGSVAETHGIRWTLIALAAGLLVCGGAAVTALARKGGEGGS